MEKTFDVMVRRFPYLAMKLQFQDLDVSRAIVVACAVQPMYQVERGGRGA